MAFRVSPGINISEQDLTTVVPNVAVAIGAFAGPFQWGPVLERTTVTTENELVDIFGKPNSDVARHWWCAANFLAYANNLLIARVVGPQAVNSAIGDNGAGTPVLVKTATAYDDVTFDAGTLFVAKYPGILGDSLFVEACDSAGFTAWTYKDNFDGAPLTSPDVANAGGSGDEMHVIVIDSQGLWTGTPGFVLEKFAYVSKAIDGKRPDGSSNYVKDVLRNESKYVWIGTVTQLTELSDDGNNVAGFTKAGSVFRQFTTSSTGYTPGGQLAGGVDDNLGGTNNVTAAKLIEGFNLFKDDSVVDVNLIIGGPGEDASDTDVGTSLVAMVGLGANARPDAMVFLSPTFTDAVTTPLTSSTTATTNMVTTKTTYGSNNFVVMDGAWKYQYDRYRDVFVYVPMNGDTAGLVARTEETNDAWWSPAGMNRGQVKNVVRLTWEPNRADRDKLYQASINPFITMRGAGVLMWGDKTCQIKPSAFDRINVRRLFIVLEKAISTAAKSLLFEFNDEFTRAQFVNMVQPFLREVQGRRGITDFKVVCDTSNNTGQIIDTNQFVGDIYIKPARSINFIQLNFIAARTDVSFSEIGG